MKLMRKNISPLIFKETEYPSEKHEYPAKKVDSTTEKPPLSKKNTREDMMIPTQAQDRYSIFSSL